MESFEQVSTARAAYEAAIAARTEAGKRDLGGAADRAAYRAACGAVNRAFEAYKAARAAHARAA